MKQKPLYMYIRMYREVYSIKRTEFSRLMHLSCPAYAHYERGRRKLCFEDACAIAGRLGISPTLLKSLPLVDLDKLKTKLWLSEPEIHASFLHFYMSEQNRMNYRYLSKEEKWWLYIYHAYKGDQQSLLNDMLHHLLMKHKFSE